MILTLQPLTEIVSDLAVVSQIAFIGLLSPYPFVQIELIEQRIIKPNEFRDAQPPHRADQPSLADGLDRFCQDHRGLQKSPITVHKNVGLVIGLLCSIGCNRRNNEVEPAIQMGHFGYHPWLLKNPAVGFRPDRTVPQRD